MQMRSLISGTGNAICSHKKNNERMLRMRRAFEGFKVIDASQGVAGPHAAMLLALHGADVIKIEPPEGDWGRILGLTKANNTIHFVAFNRGKRSIAIDLEGRRTEDRGGLSRIR